MDKLKILLEKPKEIISIVQFGSSISGDTYEGSDTDLMIVVKNSEKELERTLRKDLDYNHQLHIYNKKDFLKSTYKKNPLNLSAIHTGKTLLGSDFINNLKNYKANNLTIKKCMLNSFAALGLGISDLTNGWLWDSVNRFYHAARSSIWSTLMKKEITPNNKRVFELLADDEITKLYGNIIDFRKDIPAYEVNHNFDKELWEKGNFNKFTELLSKTNTIIKKNYKKVLEKNFIDFFELLQILKNDYKTPNHYSIMLSVDWKDMSPFYQTTLFYKNKCVNLEIDAQTGEIKSKNTVQKR